MPADRMALLTARKLVTPHLEAVGGGIEMHTSLVLLTANTISLTRYPPTTSAASIYFTTTPSPIGTWWPPEMCNLMAGHPRPYPLAAALGFGSQWSSRIATLQLQWEIVHSIRTASFFIWLAFVGGLGGKVI